MKIRNGFVSNSSSSSFCIYKELMTDKEIKEFQDLINKLNMSRSGDYPDGSPEMIYKNVVIDWDEKTWISENKNYFFGEVGHAHDRIIFRFMEMNGFYADQYVLEE